MAPPLEYGASTHVGLVRENNEDCFLNRPDISLWLVADGMGGHDAGEVASGIARDYIEQAVGKGESLKQAVEESHHAVKDAAANDIGSPNMGTTVVAIKVEGIQYTIAWVGDSRAYLWDKNHLRQISVDHSYVQELLKSGVITEDEVAHHAQRNIITQSIGVSSLSDVEVGIINGIFEPGQKILLCSDGLSDMLEDEEIENILGRTYESNQDLVDKLIAKALQNGGTDNVTVQLISAPNHQSLLTDVQRSLLQSPLGPLIGSHRNLKWLGLCVGIAIVGLVSSFFIG